MLTCSQFWKARSFPAANFHKLNNSVVAIPSHVRKCFRGFPNFLSLWRFFSSIRWDSQNKTICCCLHFYGARTFHQRNHTVKPRAGGHPSTLACARRPPSAVRIRRASVSMIPHSTTEKVCECDTLHVIGSPRPPTHLPWGDQGRTFLNAPLQKNHLRCFFHNQVHLFSGKPLASRGFD